MKNSKVELEILKHYLLLNIILKELKWYSQTPISGPECLLIVWMS